MNVGFLLTDAFNRVAVNESEFLIEIWKLWAKWAMVTEGNRKEKTAEVQQ